ncbi:MAG: FHA domain-containing protein [Actinobacteria bacterium]|nr:FHA domain-containing protein [Actinomycetota bacterium]
MGDIRGGEPAREGRRRRQDDHLEQWVNGTRELIPLTGERLTIGLSPTNDVPLPFDRTVSRVHAVIERVASQWCVRDLSSRNGTFVNGERIWRECPLRAGDEIRVGTVRFVARVDDGGVPDDATVGAESGPALTRREREVLVALCGPMFSGDVFREPATIRQIASELVVSEAAVKQHVSRLYDKFGIPEQEGRRAQLANEAIRRGAVNTAEILKGPSRDT